MKKYWKPISLILALALALALGVTALAEAPETAAEPPAADATTSATGNTDTALQEALNALAAARVAGRQNSLEAELKSYVEAGTLTQEQADLILKAYQDQQALRSGTCPNCGYQFGNGAGKGGRMQNGGFGGGRMQNGGFGNGRNGRMQRSPFGQNGLPQNGMPQENAPENPDAGAPNT